MFRSYLIASCCAFFAMVGVASANEIRIVGTGDGMDLLTALGNSYTADNPGTVVIVPPSIGSGGGIAAVGSDEETLGRVARRLKPSERKLGLIETPIFRLPAAIYTHPDVGVSSLTSGQLKSIYAGKIRNWKEVGGPDLRIKVVRREDTDSVLRVLRDTMPGWKELEITTRSKTAFTTQESFETVVEVPGAIGFGPYSKNVESSLNVLRIDGKYPTEPNYPSGVTVAYIHKEDTVSDVEREVMKYAQTEKAQQLVVSMGGVPVSN